MPITFDLSKAPPGQMSAPEIIAASIESGRSLSGVALSADVSGGGYWRIKYSNIQLSNANSTQLKYWNLLRHQLTGNVRQIVVPFLIDVLQPQPPSGGRFVPTECSDGTTTTDGYGTTDMMPMTANFGALPVNAAIMAFLYPARIPLLGGETFDILHPVKGYRAYAITDFLSVLAPDANGMVAYQVAIRPPFREAVPAGAAMNFDRPRCTMRLEPGTKMPFEIEKSWYSRPEISLVEAF